MRMRTLALLLALACPARAQHVGSSAPDPYLLPDVISSAGILTGYRDTGGLSIRNAPVNTAIKNLVLITFGQSNGMNITPTLYTPTNSSVIDHLNPYDGSFYNIGAPLLGAQYAPASNGPGNLAARIADLLVTNSNFAHVYIASLALSGTPIAQWATGGPLFDRVCVAMRRLAYRGITPATANVTFSAIWLQGEADGTSGTTSASYQASWAQIVAHAQACGYTGKFVVNEETWQSGATSATIQGAQAAVVDSVTTFAGGNLDSLTSGSRQADNTHFNDAGAASATTLIYNAMHAAGIF